METLIAVIESEMPGLKWLIRSVADGEDMERIGARYFAHIYDPDLNFNDDAASFAGANDDPYGALNEAYCRAKAEGGAA